MKKLISVLCLFLAISFVSYGQSDEEYKSTLKKMMEVSGSQETFQSAISQMFEMYKQQKPNVNEEVWNELKNEYLKTSIYDLVDELVPVYKKYLKQEELEKVIEFYQTPAGKKFAENQPFITKEAMQVGQKWGIKLGKKVMAKLKEKGY